MNKDWIELLELLNAHKVEYLIIGAWAMALHRQPRYTGDLDVLYRPSTDNADAVLAALRDFGAPTSHLTLEDLSTQGMTVTFGFPPARVDLLNWLSGMDFEDAASDCQEGILDGVTVKFLSLRALRKNKLASGRPKDILDVSLLSSLPTED